MTATTDSERAIVEEVVRRLIVTWGGRKGPPAADDRDSAAAAQDLPGRLADRVITLESLRTVPLGISRVIVGPRAVVTPAVVDELRRRGIVLVRGTAGSDGRPATSVRWLLATTCPQFSRPAWAVLGDTADWVSSRELKDIVSSCGRVVRQPSAAAVVFSQISAHAACQLNRHESIRAIVAHEVERLEEDIQSAQANVLVIDLRRKGSGLRECFEIFTRSLAKVPRHQPR